MSIELTAYDISGTLLALPTPIAYEMYSGDLGVVTTFSFKFLQSIPKEVVRLDVKKENGDIISCFVDSIQRVLDENGDNYTLNVTNDRAKVMQNQVKPTKHLVYDTSNMLEDYAKPYGITKSNLVSGTASIFETTIGMTAWDAITLFCRKVFGGYATLMQDGTLSLNNFISTPIVFGEGGLPYTYLKQKDDRTVLPSRVYMQAYDDDSDFSAYMDNEYAINCGISRVRYYRSPKQWSILTKRGASEIIRNANLKRYTYEIKVPQYLDLYPGMVVKIKGLGIDETTYYVDKTYFSKTQKGQFTRVVLCNYLMI